MICLRRGLFFSRNLTKYIDKDVYRQKLVLGSAPSLPESSCCSFIHNQSGISAAERAKESDFSKNQSSTEESEASETERKTLETYSRSFPFMDPEYLQIKNYMDLKQFTSEHINSLTADRVVKTLSSYHFFLYKEKWTNLKKLKVMDSKEFHALLKNLHKYLKQINVNELVSILAFLSKMGISNESQLVKGMIDHLMKNINGIDFVKSGMLYHYLTQVKMHKGFRENLKIEIEKQILNNWERMNDNDMLKAIHYACLSQFSLECNIKLLNAILESKTLCLDEWTFGNFLKILRKIPKRNPTHSELESKFFEYLEGCKTSAACSYDFCGFMKIYGNDVYFGDVEYKPKLVDDIIDLIIKKRMNPKYKLNCLEGLMLMRHIRHDFIRQVKDLILEDESIMKDSLNLMVFVHALAISHHYSVVQNDWLKIKNFIEGLEVLNQPRKWKELGLHHTISVSVNLLSMGIYVPRFFNSLSEECNSNSKIFESHLGRLRIMLLINEALQVLHPKYPSQFLTPEKMVQMINKTKIKTLASEERDKWLSDTKNLMERSVNSKNCVLYKCHTKMGQEIDFVVAVDEDGNPFDFSQAGIKKYNNNCVEDFNLPSKCKLILILAVPSKEYNRNVKTLSDLITLKLKTLKTMGFRTLTISKDDWMNLPENEKGPYFWDVVKSKRNDLLPSQSREFMGNEAISEKSKENFSYINLEERTNS